MNDVIIASTKKLDIPKSLIEANCIDSSYIYRLPKEILLMFTSTKGSIKLPINRALLKAIDDEFGIDSYNALIKAIESIRVSESSNYYTLAVNSNNGDTLDNLIRIITDGNRSVQGYPVILKIFEFVRDYFWDILRSMT